MVGRAVFKMVLSITTTSRLRHITSRITRRRGCPSGQRLSAVGLGMRSKVGSVSTAMALSSL